MTKRIHSAAVRWLLAATLAALVGASLPATAEAALTPAQRRELLDTEGTLSRVASLVNKKDTAAAEKMLAEAEQKIDKIAADAKLPAGDPLLARLKANVLRQRTAIARLKGEDPPAPGGAGPGGVTFTRNVEPILKQYCGSCHGANNGRKGLSLTSAAGVTKGGESGPAVVPGNAGASLLLKKIADGSMPPGNRPAPNAAEVAVLTAWVAGGAKDAPLKPGEQPAKVTPKLADVTIPKPTGGETVSFTRDIAPFMVNLCVGCHSGNNPRGGLNLTTVRNMMVGGNSGAVIKPGNMEGSRLFRLVGGLELPRMPANQARITRKNYEDLKKWFQEGNKFDVADPDKLLRDIVPTDAELLAERLAKMTPEEFGQMRLQRTHEFWTAALPKQTYQVYETDDFLVVGNVPGERIEQVGRWSAEHAGKLREMFAVPKGEPLWRGKLAVYLIGERFDFNEFNLINERREAAPELTGYAKVTANTEDAYAVVLDSGAEPSEGEPGLRVAVLEQVTSAFLQREGGKLPEWLARGLGLALAAESDPENPYFRGLSAVALEQTARVQNPEDVFKDGQFAPAVTGAVGYTLVDFLLKAGKPRFGQFINALKSGTKVDAAIRGVYGADPKAVALNYYNGLRARRR